MFRASQRPSSGVLKTVTATSGIGHNNGAATSFQRGLIRASVASSWIFLLLLNHDARNHESKIKMCLQEVGWEGMNWMYLAQHRDVGNFLTR
jgi:hypothetical protein